MPLKSSQPTIQFQNKANTLSLLIPLMVVPLLIAISLLELFMAFGKPRNLKVKQEEVLLVLL